MESIYQTPSKFCNVVEQQSFWSKVIANQKTSGLSIKRFCKQHQISFSTFTYWKYKKNKLDSKLANSIIRAKNKQSDKKVAKFISLQVASDIPSNEKHKKGAVDAEDGKIEFVFKNGNKMTLSLIISDTNLLSLIKSVGGL